MEERERGVDCPPLLLESTDKCYRGGGGVL